MADRAAATLRALAAVLVVVQAAAEAAPWAPAAELASKELEAFLSSVGAELLAGLGCAAAPLPLPLQLATRTGGFLGG
jgi:hypothetical protein